MTKYNLYTLLHRNYSWTVTLPDGSVQSGQSVREIPVRIPRIQRDYAEGRSTEMIERKRYNLLNDMLDVVYGIRENLSFDFIYGYLTNNGESVSDGWQDTNQYLNVAFEPLDGQGTDRGVRGARAGLGRRAHGLGEGYVRQAGDHWEREIS